MKKMVGFSATLIAVGMLLMFLLNNRITGLVLMSTFALLGYCALFCD